MNKGILIIMAILGILIVGGYVQMSDLGLYASPIEMDRICEGYPVVRTCWMKDGYDSDDYAVYQKCQSAKRTELTSLGYTDCKAEDLNYGTGSEWRICCAALPVAEPVVEPVVETPLTEDISQIVPENIEIEVSPNNYVNILLISVIGVVLLRIILKRGF